MISILSSCLCLWSCLFKMVLFIVAISDTLGPSGLSILIMGGYFQFE